MIFTYNTASFKQFSLYYKVFLFYVYELTCKREAVCSLTFGQIAKFLGIHPITAARMIINLRNDGYLATERHGCNQYTLTEKALEEIARVD